MACAAACSAACALWLPLPPPRHTGRPAAPQDGGPSSSAGGRLTPLQRACWPSQQVGASCRAAPKQHLERLSLQRRLMPPFQSCSGRLLQQLEVQPAHHDRDAQCLASLAVQPPLRGPWCRPGTDMPRRPGVHLQRSQATADLGRSSASVDCSDRATCWPSSLSSSTASPPQYSP